MLLPEDTLALFPVALACRNMSLMSRLGGLFVPALGLSEGLVVILAGDLLWSLGRGGAVLPPSLLAGALADTSMPLVILAVFEWASFVLPCVLQLPS